MAHNDSIERLAALGVLLPEILVPARGVDIGVWAVIACDQYTSEPEYWENAARLAEGKPSALHCILPELYLGTPRAEAGLAAVKKTMRDYLARGIFTALPPGLVLVDRRTPFTDSRRGMVLALDMESYDYKPGTTSLIRPTEGTIEERLPPRVKIREDAALELPHIMVLIDDPRDEVLGPLFALAAGREPVYEGGLMLGSGFVSGRRLSAEEAAPHLAETLAALHKRSGGHSPLFAMGDGNHSLATAKAVWEKLKPSLSADEQKTHPLRYALVEIVNLYDPGLTLHPIHRVVSGIRPADFFAFCRNKPGFRLESPRLSGEDSAADSAEFRVDVLSAAEKAVLVFERKNAFLPAAAVQSLLEEFLSARGGKIDYIHGEDSLAALCGRADSAGLLLPALPKERLFPLVVRDGVLPRKAFSIGEAPEKRFYIEARRIGNGRQAAKINFQSGTS